MRTSRGLVTLLNFSEKLGIYGIVKKEPESELLLLLGIIEDLFLWIRVFMRSWKTLKTKSTG